MKKLFLILVFSFLSCMLFAAPFGLKMGMTVEEIKTACNGIKPKYYERDIYFITPKKKHPLFETYGVFVDEKQGLYKIRCVSREIITGNDGAELKSSFENALKVVSKTYGEPDIIDISDSNIIDKEWFSKLRNGKVSTKVQWTKTTKLSESNIEKIELKIIPDDRDYSAFKNIGAIVLNYYFKNTSSVEDEQDSVF